MTPFFYKIPMGKNKGEDVSELQAELKDKLTHLNKVGEIAYIWNNYMSQVELSCLNFFKNFLYIKWTSSDAQQQEVFWRGFSHND